MHMVIATMCAIGEFIRLFRQEGLTPKQISADASGLGLPICDRFREQGWNLHRVRNEKPASNPDAFANTGAEIWFNGARQIQIQSVVLPYKVMRSLAWFIGWPKYQDHHGKLPLGASV